MSNEVNNEAVEKAEANAAQETKNEETKPASGVEADSSTATTAEAADPAATETATETEAPTKAPEVTPEATPEVTPEVVAEATTPQTKAPDAPSSPEEKPAETPAVEAVETAPSEAAEATAEAEEESGDMDFGAMLEQFEQDQVTYHTGELVTGKVVGISDNSALVDFGYKSEGSVSLEEFTSDEGEVTIKQGDEVEVVIKSMGSGDSPPVLSRFDAERRKTWGEIENAFNDEIPVTGRIIEKTKGGLKVNVSGVEAFLPGSQVDSRPVRNLDSMIGQEIEARVIKFSRKRNNIVLSRKVITDQVVNKLKAETLKRIEEGYIEEGTVKNLTDYGAFVDIGGIDGLLHVTDMSWGRLHNPSSMFKVGEVVQVKILKLDREKEKVSLGFKQLLPDPWSTVTELYPVNKKVTGHVSSVTEYGAFVELEAGVEGLVHVSEMSWSKRLKHPKHLVKKGDEVEVQVLGIDPEERRISLGIKQLQDNPWDSLAERYHVGTKIEGKVRNLTDFGAFVEVEEGVDGLVHISDISWSKNIKHPKEVLKKGQEVEAVVTSIDVDGRRLSLSIKQLTPSAWEQFTSDHKAGDTIKGKISRFASFGVFVELAQDLEGLCHISELSDDRVDDPEDLFDVGQELDFKILRIEHDVEKIGLSHRAVGRDDEPVIDSRSYSSSAKGGMASLGELANLNIGGSASESAEEESVEEPQEVTESASEAGAATDEANAAEEVTAEVAEEVKEPVSEEKSEEAPADENASEEQPAESPAEEGVDADAKSEEPASEAQETPAEGSGEESAEDTSNDSSEGAEDSSDASDAGDSKEEATADTTESDSEEGDAKESEASEEESKED